jgi:16S rRNA (cytosine967-C5)-methyltransferase
VSETSDKTGMRARDVALCVLADARAGRQTAKRSLDDLISRYRIVSEDVALATELVWGVLRHRLTLTAVLEYVIAAKWRRLSRTLQHILLIGAYQLIWLDGVPDFAAINEAVEQAKREGGRRAGGFVNGVLRTLQRLIVERDARGRPDHPMRCIVTGRDRYCRLAEAVFADPEDEAVAYLSAATSHPPQLVRRWINAFGDMTTRTICHADMLSPPIVLRVNRLRATAADAAERLGSDGCFADVVGEHALVVRGPASFRAVLQSGAFRDGCVQPQDITSQAPVEALELAPGQIVLDLCAGRGTKATQAAECMRDRGRVIATDIDPHKLTAMHENARRLGIRCITIVEPGALRAELETVAHLDAVLVDAPCSNTGVLARRPDARYRFSARQLTALVEIQRGLLHEAAAMARDKTKLCYATCSIEREENEGVVEAFCREHGDWRLVASHRTFPSAGDELPAWRDGGYWAILQRA